MTGRTLRCFRPGRNASLGKLAATLATFVAMTPIGGLRDGGGFASRVAMAQAPAGEAANRVGRMVRIASPLTDGVDAHVRKVVESFLRDSKQQALWPVFIFEIRPGRIEFGRALDLARYLSSPELNGATTVAYLPESISGHAVLLAMACDEIIMHEEAEIGQAGEFDATIEPSTRNAYREIAARRKTIPADLALGMLDPAVEVLLVETDVSREYVLSDRLEELKRQKSFDAAKTKVLIPAGQSGMFTGREGWELGFVSYLAKDRLDMAVNGLGLSREALRDDPAADGTWRPVRIDVKGPISPNTVNQVQNLIDEHVSGGRTNFICLWIDSPGGSPADSVNLAHFVAGLDPNEHRTVAYVPNEARADAAFIALACDDLVMLPGAILGGPGAYEPAKDEIALAAAAVEDIARTKFRSAALAAAFADPDARVYRSVRQRDGLIDYLREEELADQEARGEIWQQGDEITQPGRAFFVEGQRATELGIARATVEDFQEFKTLYQLSDDPALAEPGWADFLIESLRSPQVRWLLLLVAGAAFYIELQAPGIGLGGLTSALCVLLYFWSAHLGGTAGWLEALLFLGGAVCLVIEVFVLPGFGVFGVFGGLLVISSVVLASQTFVHGQLFSNEWQLGQFLSTLKVLTTAAVATMVAVGVMRHYLPHTPVLRGVVLAPPDDADLELRTQREASAPWDHLVGQRGAAVTPLLPGGKSRFGDELVDVIADGEFIDRGRPVEVVEVRGNRILVREVT